MSPPLHLHPGTRGAHCWTARSPLPLNSPAACKTRVSSWSRAESSVLVILMVVVIVARWGGCETAGTARGAGATRGAVNASDEGERMNVGEGKGARARTSVEVRLLP